MSRTPIEIKTMTTIRDPEEGFWDGSPSLKEMETAGAIWSYFEEKRNSHEGSANIPCPDYWDFGDCSASCGHYNWNCPKGKCGIPCDLEG